MSEIRKHYFLSKYCIYPAFSPAPVSPESPEKQENGQEVEPGYGFHEIIVESPLHGRRLEDFSDSEISRLMKVYRDRTCSLPPVKRYAMFPCSKILGKKQGLRLTTFIASLLPFRFAPLFWQGNWRLSVKKRYALTVLSLIWKRHLPV